MENSDLQVLQIYFDETIKSVIELKNDVYKKRNEFLQKFSVDNLKHLTLKEYALGKENTKETFCYYMEFSLDKLGSMGGSPATKFGIYYGNYKGKQGTKYWFTKKFGSTKEEAFQNVKNEIISLVKAGKKGSLEEIKRNKLAPNFKGKILSTYYPEKYLPIFSNEHLSHFLVQFDLDSEKNQKADVFKKRQILLDYKNQDKIMRNWSSDMFSHFLYHIFPKAPSKNNNPTRGKIIEFPIDQSLNPINLKIKPYKEQSNKDRNNSNKSKSSNPNYEKIARNNKRIGSRGETLVIQYEIKKLQKWNLSKLSQKVKKVPLDIDGYDINSFDENGNKIKIEVKSTTSKVGQTRFFLTSNELEKAKIYPEYRLYIVYDINSKNPVIWEAGNPFINSMELISIEPINYIVKINTEKYDA